jgi:hypothetical protein
MCVGWKVIGEKESHVISMPGVYTDDSSETREFYYALKDAEHVVAHNAPFEQAIYNHVHLQTTPMGAKMRTLKPKDYICTLSLCSILALPRSLEGASNALNLPFKKDMEGRKLLLQMCKPRPPIQNLKAWIEWRDENEFMQRLYEYCRTDLKTEEALYNALIKYRPFTKKERDLWILDQKINQRGFTIDIELVDQILKMIKEEESELTKDLRLKTFGTVKSAKSTAALKTFLHDQGFQIPNLQKKTIDDTLKEIERSKRVADQDVIDVLKIRQSLGKSSTSKYQAFRDRCDTLDNRVRDNLLFHGASTGRWCLSGDTEFFDGQKWKKFEDSGEHENIMCYDPKKGEYFFDRCRINKWDINENIYKGIGPKFPFIFTKEHKWLVDSEPKRIFIGHGIKITKAAIGRYISDTPALAPLETRIVLMAQADGHYMGKKKISLRFHFRKQRKIERCEKLLNDAGIRYRRVDRKSGTEIVAHDLPTYLQGFVNKKLCDFSYDPHAFMDEIHFWDGHLNSKTMIEYTSTDEDNANFVSAFAVSCGWGSIMRKKQDRPGWKPRFRVYLTKKNTAVLCKQSLRTVDFSGQVFCPETRSGFFVARRQGVASITGNSGSGVQPQNFPRGTMKVEPSAYGELLEGDLGMIRLLYEKPMDLFSSALRGVIIASEGKELFCADFSSIEARVLLWLAGDKSGLNEYMEGLDVYCSMASTIYGIDYDDVLYEYKSEGFSDRRQMGKKVILACGYQMGLKKFMQTCIDEGLDVEMSLLERAHQAFREKYPLVPELWNNYERAAIYAVINKGKKVLMNKVTWYVQGDFLFAELPSGRKLAYYKPEVRNEETPWGDLRPKLYVYTTDSKTKQWVQRAVYGGLLTENICQAVSRDCMSEAMTRVDAAGFDILITVHDEILCERNIGESTLKDFEKLMSERPYWGQDIPLKVGGWVGQRYRK